MDWNGIISQFQEFQNLAATANLRGAAMPMKS
jgi:hypothetical protein